MSETPLIPPKNLGGRPRKGEYPPEKLLEICTRVSLGETLTQIAKEPGLPSPSAFRAAVARGGPALQDAWERAKQERPHSIFEQAIDLTRELHTTAWQREDTNRVRALESSIEALLKAASRLAPRDYGDRQTGAVVVPVQINTTLALSPGAPASRRSSIYQIEVADPTDELK